MNKYLTLIFTLFLAVACSSVPTTEHQLYDLYSEYLSKANADNLFEIVPSYFSVSLLNKGDLKDPHQKSFFLFENSIANEINHYETVRNGVGWLTINGTDQANHAVVFSLEYISSGEAWLINEIHVIYGEDIPMTQATCPNEYGALN